MSGNIVIVAGGFSKSTKEGIKINRHFQLGLNVVCPNSFCWNWGWLQCCFSQGSDSTKACVEPWLLVRFTRWGFNLFGLRSCLEWCCPCFLFWVFVWAMPVTIQTKLKNKRKSIFPHATTTFVFAFSFAKAGYIFDKRCFFCAGGRYPWPKKKKIEFNRYFQLGLDVVYPKPFQLYREPCATLNFISNCVEVVCPKNSNWTEGMGLCHPLRPLGLDMVCPNPFK